MRGSNDFLRTVGFVIVRDQNRRRENHGYIGVVCHDFGNHAHNLHIGQHADFNRMNHRVFEQCARLVIYPVGIEWHDRFQARKIPRQ